MQSVFTKVFNVISRGCLTVRDVLQRLLLEKDQFGQADKVYESLNMDNLFQVVQAVGLVWAASLMFTKREKNEEKTFKIDKLFYS